MIELISHLTVKVKAATIMIWMGVTEHHTAIIQSSKAPAIPWMDQATVILTVLTTAEPARRIQDGRELIIQVTMKIELVTCTAYRAMEHVTT